jgi:thiamine-phosphate pyrophosphorylase
MTILPALYPILDLDALACTGDDAIATLCSVARELAAAGCTVMQYRAKHLAVRDALAQARELKRILPNVTWIMNDRADLCLAAGFAGVHVGQDDLSPEAVRRVVGPDRIVGCSTHNPVQVAEALAWPVDYIAIGPVFATGSKQRPDPVVGLEGVAEARRLLLASGRDIPLVAIGGITRANAAAVRAAGATSLAVIGDLCSSPGDSAEEFFRLMM